ncbi:protein O-mannosyl-transferase Tmtc3-like isoform X2 [Gordionus sp. m RMFG-2023]
MSGLNPTYFHLVNVLLHYCVCLLVHSICKALMKNDKDLSSSDQISLHASLLFAVHPIHCDAVTSIVGRSEILAGLFFLSSFTFFVNATRNPYTKPYKFSISMMFALFSMLSKEQGITIIGILIVYEILYNIFLNNYKDKQLVVKTLFSSRIKSMILSLNLCLFMRIWVMGSQLPQFFKFDNPASHARFPVRQLTYNYLAALNIWKLIFPYKLSCDWSMGSISLLTLMDHRNLLTLVIYSIILILLWKTIYHIFQGFKGNTNLQESKFILMGLLLLIVPYIPASNLFFPVGFVLAERILYIPSIGLCFLVSFGIHKLMLTSFKFRLFKNRSFWVYLLILVCSLKTYRRNTEWMNEKALMQSAIKIIPQNAKLWNNLGHYWERKNKLHYALAHYKKAIKHQSDDVGAFINIGRIYCKLNLLTDCEKSYKKGVDLLSSMYIEKSNHIIESFHKTHPKISFQIPLNWIDAYIGMGDVINKNKIRTREAIYYYELALYWQPNNTKARLKLAQMLHHVKNYSQSQKEYLKAIQNTGDQKTSDFLYEVAVDFLDKDTNDYFLKHIEDSLILNPCHAKSLIWSAIYHISRLGDTSLSLAREKLLKIIDCPQSVHNAQVEILAHSYYLLAQLSINQGDHRKALEFILSSLQFNPTHQGSLYNAALIMRDNLRQLKSVTNFKLSAIKSLKDVDKRTFTIIKKLESILYESKSFVDRLLKWYPTHVKGLLLSGDIYYRDLEDPVKALFDYESAIKLLSESFDAKSSQIYPEKDQVWHLDSYPIVNRKDGEQLNHLFVARHNVCLIYIETRKLIKARDCVNALQNDTTRYPVFKAFSKIILNSQQRLLALQ